MSTSLSRCGGKYHLGNEEDEGEEDEGEEAEAEDEAEEDEEDVGFHQDSEEEGRSSTTPRTSTTTSSSTTYETSTWITTTETSTSPLPPSPSTKSPAKKITKRPSKKNKYPHRYNDCWKDNKIPPKKSSRKKRIERDLYVHAASVFFHRASIYYNMYVDCKLFLINKNLLNYEPLLCYYFK